MTTLRRTLSTPPLRQLGRGLTALMLALACGRGAAQAGTVPSDLRPSDLRPPDEVLAVVGSGPQTITVTRAEAEHALRLAASEMLGRQGLPLSPELFATYAPARQPFFEQLLQDKKLEYLAREALPDFAASRTQLGAGPQSFGSAAAYNDYLRGAGYRDETDYAQEASRQALLQTYREAVQRRFAFGDGAVASYYALNRRQFQQRQESCVRHILLPTEAEARDLRGLLLGGADFALLAHTHSRDPGSAALGGDLGCWGPGQTAFAFDQALREGPPGVPLVVRTPQGWHVLEITARHEGGLLPLTEAAPLIRRELAREAAERLIVVQLSQVPLTRTAAQF